MHVISSGFELVNRVLMFDIREIFIIHLQNNIMKSEKQNSTRFFVSLGEFRYFSRWSRSARPPSVIRVMITAAESLIQGVS